MTAAEAREEIQQLSARIHHLNEQYYQHHNSEVSDKEFDQMLARLQQLEEQFPEFQEPDSPTLRVGGTITKNFETVTHRYPMLSLGYVIGAIGAWLFLGEVISPQRMLAIGVIMLGVVLLARS